MESWIRDEFDLFSNADARTTSLYARRVANVWTIRDVIAEMDGGASGTYRPRDARTSRGR